MGVGIRSAAAVGDRLWLGLANGGLRVFSAGPKPGLLAHWSAHDSAVAAISQAGRRVFTLGADGSIRGWQELEAHMGELVSRRNYTCAAMTWNVNEQRPEASATFSALRDAAADAHLVVVGLQEIEMGGSSVAIAAAKDAIARSMLEKGNANAHWWGKRCLAALGGGAGGPWEKLGLRQLSGMLVLVFARQALLEFIGEIAGAGVSTLEQSSLYSPISYLTASLEVLREVVGEVATASVATGVLGVGGNKGAVALGFTLHRRRVAILASHFAAHQGAVEARNANYAQIAAHLHFKRGAHAANADAADGAREVKHVGSTGRTELAEAEGAEPPASLQDELEAQGEGVGSAELLVWMGDFNYRIIGERDAVVASVRRFLLRGDPAALQQLLAQDQLQRELAAGRVFRFMHEAPVTFAPTYKFDKGDAAPLAYDSSDKQRVPAWCDRILFRGSELTRTSAQDARHSGRQPDAPDLALEAEAIRVNCDAYTSVPGAIESDHKPVLARLAISMPVTDQARKRSRASAILAAADARAAAGEGAPAAALHPAAVTITAGSPPAELLQLVNRGDAPAVFSLAPAPAGGVTRDGLPSWLVAHPARGLLRPGDRVAICLGAHPSQHSRPLQAKLAVRVLPLHALGGVADGQQLLRLSVTCAPADGRAPPLLSLRQDAVSVRHF